MKTSHLFALVAAFHVVAILIFFLTPGCRGSGKSLAQEGDRPETARQAGWGTVLAQTNQPDFSDFNAIPTPSAASRPLDHATPAERARTAPTRPDTARPQPAPAPAARQPQRVPAPPEQTRTYLIARGDSLWSIAQRHETTVQAILEANPGIRANQLQVGQSILIPLPGPAPEHPAAAPAEPVRTISGTEYTVQRGDSLSGIAAKHNVSVSSLRSANQIQGDLIRVGQVLVIPDGRTRLDALESERREPVGQRNGQITVTIQPGDTLGAIARKFDVTVQELMRVNGIQDPRRIRAGQELIIPGFQAVTAPPAPPPARAEPRAPAPRTPQPAAPRPLPELPDDIDLDLLLDDDHVDAPVVPLNSGRG